MLAYRHTVKSSNRTSNIEALFQINSESSITLSTAENTTHTHTCTHARTHARTHTHTHTHTHTFNGPFSRTTRVSPYQKGKTNLDFTEARNSEWQWHQLGHMQVSISLQTDNLARTPPLSFLQAGCPSCCPTNSVIALKATIYHVHRNRFHQVL